MIKANNLVDLRDAILQAVLDDFNENTDKLPFYEEGSVIFISDSLIIWSEFNYLEIVHREDKFCFEVKLIFGSNIHVLPFPVTYGEENKELSVIDSMMTELMKELYGFLNEIDTTPFDHNPEGL